MALSPRASLEARPMRAGKLPLLNRTLSRLLAPRSPLGYGQPIPPEDRILVTDVSKWNGNNDFTQMLEAGAMGTMMRASLCWLNNPQCATDDKFAQNSQAASALQYPFGCYHFLSDQLPGATQAAYFLNVINGSGAQLPACVDVELQYVSAAKVRAFVETVAETLGYYLSIYTSGYFWGKVWGTTDKAWLSAHCPLWVAHWNTLNPLLPTGWNEYAMHQWSADGNGRAAEFGSTGGDPDIDLNYCRRSWFEQFAPLPADWRQSITAWARTMGYQGPDPA